MWGHFHKLSPTFLSNFTDFFHIRLFNVNGSGTGIENTFAYRCHHNKKSYGVGSELLGGHKNATGHTVRQSPNFCLKHWTTKLVVCRVATSCWNHVCFRTTWHLFNSKKKVFNIFSYHSEFILKPETHYPDAMWHDVTLHDEITSGTVILNKPNHTFLMWCDTIRCDEDLEVFDFQVASCHIK